MSTTTLQSIKAVLNFRRMATELVVSTSHAICTKMDNNLKFTQPLAPAPPFEISKLKAETDALAAANSAVLGGAGKEAIAQRKRQKEIVVKLLVQLGHYVEAN